jgi:hypothetical protein
MAQTIKLKRSNTSGSKPTTSNLALGEIALNTKDGLFFLRRYVDGTDGNDTITAYTPEYINEYSSQIDVTVTVDTKTAAHPEYNNGSSNGYLLDGIEGPFLALTPGNTYRFDQSDSSNSGHPFRFYLEADKTTAYTTGVTTNGTAGSSGAYTEIAVSTSTPQVLYYQCSAHSYMGSGSYTEAGTISTSQLQADSVTTAKIAPNAITSAEIAQNSIGSSEIAENTVGSSEIAENSITSVHIATGVVIETDVANNSITSSKIATNAVGSTEIAQNSILTKHIDDNQIGIDQLNVTDGTSGQALTTDGAGTLSFSTVASSLSGASDTDITSPSSGQILVHDGTDSFDNVSISGDATLASDGTLTIATNAIESTMIAQNSILTKHIDDNQIGIDQLNVTDGTSGQVLTTDGAGSLSFSTVSGGSGSQNLFSTVAVSGQSDIVADSTTDTLTVAAGSGISLTTNASTDTLTITATGSGLSANAVTSAYLASNAVLSRHIATDAVGSSELAATGVSAGTYGSSTATPQFTVDTDGRITSVGNVTISSSGGGGSAGLNQVINTYESTGDGSTVAFDTGTTITSEDLTWVFIDGVYQEKGAYSTSGSTVTFSAAPPNGTSIEILNLSSITTGGAFDHNSFSGDGSTTDFTLANTPDSETDLIVFIDGVYQNNNAFNVSGTTLSFDTAPANGTTVIAYSIGGVVTGKANIVNTFNGDSSTTDFTLSIDPKDEKNTIVFVGGVYQPKATYSISGTTLTFSEAPPTGTGNIEVSISQITTTTQLASDILDGNTFTGDTELTGELTAGEFVGNLRGATLFKGQAGEALSKGDVVYISGISGNTTVVSKADADDATKMPAFGIVAEDASNNTSATVYTFGSLTGLDTSSFSEGDELFVSTTAGTLTDTPPTGESSALQKIAKVTRSDNSAGSIFIMGAGRSNAVPNLDDGDIFIGNGSNQAVTSALSTEVESYLDGGTSTPSFASLNVTTTTTDDSVTITTTEDSSSAAPVVTLKRNSSSPADADYLGQIKFKGENDGDQEVVYAKITGKIGDNTDTTEDGIIEFANVKDGSQTITVRLKSDEMQLINSTGLNVGGTSVLSGLTYPTSDGSAGQYLQTDGAGNLSFSTVNSYTDSDVETYLNTSEIYTDASNNRLGILQASPAVSLDVGSATDAFFVPKGTTAQRPTGVDGYFRYNTDDAQFEGYADGAWGAIAGSGGASAMETNNFTGDGSTTAFTLSSSVSSEDNLIVFIEGIYQNKGDYVASGTTITFDTAPVNGRRIVVQHIKSSISGNSTLYTSLTGDGSTTAFTLSGAPGNENNTQVFMDGVYQQKDSYTVSGTTLTFDAAPANNVEIEVMSFTQTTLNTPAANSVGVTELNLSDGTAGQFITTDGNGTISFATVNGTTINNNADNRIITGSGTANTLEGEANLTYDGTSMSIGGTGSVKIPSGTTAQRPSSPTAGMVRYNTTEDYVEYYNGSAWFPTSETGVDASGGTETTVGGYKIHTFTTSGTLTVTSGGDVEYLVIAGGGGGGCGTAGGGGAGGYRTNVSGETSGGGASAESSLNLSTGSYTITVGAGGAGGVVSTSNVSNGSNSIFASITSIGGGAGGEGNTNNTRAAGQSGGSGGGDWSYGGDSRTNGSGTSGQGYDGGTGASDGGSGGGGAGAVGGSGSSANKGGDGGNGVSSSITGSAVVRGGGGAGSGFPDASSGGTGGGGGSWYSNYTQAGTANTGGGGAGDYAYASGNGGNGGSGIVIIRYPV